MRLALEDSCDFASLVESLDAKNNSKTTSDTASSNTSTGSVVGCGCCGGGGGGDDGGAAMDLDTAATTTADENSTTANAKKSKRTTLGVKGIAVSVFDADPRHPVSKALPPRDFFACIFFFLISDFPRAPPPYFFCIFM